MKVINSKKGKKIYLYSPADKANKYANELKVGVKTDRDFSPKYDKNGELKKLSLKEKFFRIGYLKARSDNAKAYKHNLKRKGSH